MSASVFAVARQRWVAEVERIVASGYYASRARWENYFHTHVEPNWQQRLRLPSTTDLTRRLGLTPTMLGMILLVGRGYRRFKHDRHAPLIKAWPPFVDRDKEVRIYHSIPKGDQARILGVSRSAIQHAVDRFRGKGDADPTCRTGRLFGVLPLGSGVLLDLVLETQDEQQSFSFNYTDYTASKAWVRDAAIDDRLLRDATEEWVADALPVVAPNIREMARDDDTTPDLAVAT